MSLVISVFNSGSGIAVSEGRVGVWTDGKYIATDDNTSKISRVAGGLLGIAGHSRPGFKTYAQLTVVADVLRSAIARFPDFSTAADAIPHLLSGFVSSCPELYFCVSLVGEQGGKIHGVAFDSDGEVSRPVGDGTTWLIMGPSAAVDAQIDGWLRVALEGINLHDAAALIRVESVMRLAASRNEDIGANTFSETISVRRESMNASNITAGTMAATKVLFADGSELTTASRVLTASGVTTTLQTVSTANTWVIVAGLDFTVTVASALDVFNFIGFLGLICPQAVRVGLFDSVAGETLPQYLNFVAGYPTTPVFFSYTGLSAGVHNLSIQVFVPGPMDEGGSLSIVVGSSVICQRIF